MQHSTVPRQADTLDRALNGAVQVLTGLFLLLPTWAQALPIGDAFTGITDFLKSLTNLLIYEWGYYVGIITLAIQGFRWKTGRIDLMQLGGWGLGIGLVFFAPSIVSDIKSRAGGKL